MTIVLYREEVVVACVNVWAWYSLARNWRHYDQLQSASIAPVDIRHTTMRYRRVEEVAVEPRRTREVGHVIW
jgi:hypothetical protein